MDPVTLVLVPGIIGGLAVALAVFWSNRRSHNPSVVARRQDSDGPMTDMINMASIKVAGVGGLGLVAMATTVALNVPQIGAAIGLGFVLGSVAAVILILRARRAGPMPSSGKGIGASTVLSLQNAPAPGVEPDADTGHDIGRGVSLVPVS